MAISKMSGTQRITAETLVARREVDAKPSTPTLCLEPAAISLAGCNRRIDVTHRIVKLGLPLLVMLAAAGCTTMGVGTGATLSGADPVSFSWKQSGSVSGTMDATAPDGKTYSGQFFQVTKDTRVDSLDPLWVGWGRGWRGGWGGFGWRDWNSGPTFITHYTGRVVANLGAPSGEHMRCKFQLAHPSSGMAGGGRGQCQMPDGKTIDTTFPQA
jgi:hypothetical protein